MDGWMMDNAILRPFQQYFSFIRTEQNSSILFNSISVISGRCMGDNERLHAMEPRVRLERFSPQAGLEPWTARSVGQQIAK